MLLNLKQSIIDKLDHDTFDFSAQLNGVYVDISPDSWSDLIIIIIIIFIYSP